MLQERVQVDDFILPALSWSKLGVIIVFKIEKKRVMSLLMKFALTSALVSQIDIAVVGVLNFATKFLLDLLDTFLHFVSRCMGDSEEGQLDREL